MSSIITLHIGGSGIKVGLNFWQSMQLQSFSTQPQHGIDYPDKFFKQDIDGNIKPRAIFIDCDQRSYDEINKSLLNFDTGCIKEFSNRKGLFSEGFFQFGGEMQEVIVNNLRKSIEQCDLLSGFIMTSSPEGGVGSGISSKILEWIHDEDYLSLIQDFKIIEGEDPIYSQQLLPPLKIYNTILCMNYSLQNSTSIYTYQNYAAYKKFTEQSNLHPTFDDVNFYYGKCLKQHIMPYISSGFLNTSQRKRNTNMVPHPRLKMMCGGLGSGLQHIREAMNAKNSFMSCQDVWGYGYFYTMSLNVRDNLASQSQTYKQISQWLKSCPKNFPVLPSPYNLSLYPQTPSFPQKSTYCLTNGCHSVQWLQKTLDLFSSYRKKKAFLNHYMRSGMQEFDFYDAESNVQDLILEYLSIVTESDDFIEQM